MFVKCCDESDFCSFFYVYNLVLIFLVVEYKYSYFFKFYISY